MYGESAAMANVLPAFELEAGARRTILLVEDEDMVRALLAEVLRRQGYDVLSCAHPREGIEVCQRNSHKIDVLLTDMAMPEMNGREMAKRILATMPDLRVLFMSGYSEQSLPEAGEISSKCGYLQKPFTLSTLMLKLSEVLEEEAAPVQ
jgi:CheY-like chemotaxis protein